MDSRPNDGGMVPEILEEERLSSWRDEREESCGGKEVMLRKMLGRERDMTLFCGEQVMPCHEHGVGWEGFHVGSMEDGDAMLAAAMRERRAWPSGEREEMKEVVKDKKNNDKKERELGKV